MRCYEEQGLKFPPPARWTAQSRFLNSFSRALTPTRDVVRALRTHKKLCSFEQNSGFKTALIDARDQGAKNGHTRADGNATVAHEARYQASGSLKRAPRPRESTRQPLCPLRHIPCHSLPPNRRWTPLARRPRGFAHSSSCCRPPRGGRRAAPHASPKCRHGRVDAVARPPPPVPW